MRGPSPALHGTAVFPAVPRASCCWFTGDALQRVSKHMRKPLCALWVVRVRTCSVEQAQRDVARAQSVAGFSVLRFSFLVPVFVRFGSFFFCVHSPCGWRECRLACAHARSAVGSRTRARRPEQKHRLHARRPVPGKRCSRARSVVRWCCWRRWCYCSGCRAGVLRLCQTPRARGRRAATRTATRTSSTLASRRPWRTRRRRTRALRATRRSRCSCGCARTACRAA